MRRPAVYTFAGVLLGFVLGAVAVGYAYGLGGVPGQPYDGPIGGA